MAIEKVKMVKVTLVRSTVQTEMEGRVYESREWDLKLKDLSELPTALVNDMHHHIGNAFPEEFNELFGKMMDSGKNSNIEIAEFKLTLAFREDSVYVN